MKLLYVIKDPTLMSRHPWSLCVAITGIVVWLPKRVRLKWLQCPENAQYSDDSTSGYWCCHLITVANLQSQCLDVKRKTTTFTFFKKYIKTNTTMTGPNLHELFSLKKQKFAVWHFSSKIIHGGRALSFLAVYYQRVITELLGSSHAVCVYLKSIITNCSKWLHLSG